MSRQQRFRGAQLSGAAPTSLLSQGTGQGPARQGLRNRSKGGPRPLPPLRLSVACRGVWLAARAEGALSTRAGGRGQSAGARSAGSRGLRAWRAALRCAGRGGGGRAAWSARAGRRGGGRRSLEPLPALRSSMALPGPPEPPRGASRKAPSLLEMGALCLDSEIILGFTSHLLRRRAKVRAGRGHRRCPATLWRGSRRSGRGAGKAAVCPAARAGDSRRTFRIREREGGPISPLKAAS